MQTTYYQTNNFFKIQKSFPKRKLAEKEDCTFCHFCAKKHRLCYKRIVNMMILLIDKYRRCSVNAIKHWNQINK